MKQPITDHFIHSKKLRLSESYSQAKSNGSGLNRLVYPTCVQVDCFVRIIGDYTIKNTTHEQ